LTDIKEIMLTYHFFPSADQSVANVLQEQIEKHQAEERELVKRR
jgi:cytochrome c oxidase assembly protein Cox11